MPAAGEIEAGNFAALRGLFKEAGILLSLGIPLDRTGIGADHVASAIVAELLSELGSFSVSLAAHRAAILSLGWDGDTRCLPMLEFGEGIGAYALHESGGSGTLFC